MEWNVQPDKNSSSKPPLPEQHPVGGNDDTRMIRQGKPGQNGRMYVGHVNPVRDPKTQFQYKDSTKKIMKVSILLTSQLEFDQFSYHIKL